MKATNKTPKIPAPKTKSHGEVLRLNKFGFILFKKVPSRDMRTLPRMFRLFNGYPKKSLCTALFTNRRILKFKSQLTIALFAAVNHLNGPLRKQNFALTGSKGHGL